MQKLLICVHAGKIVRGRADHQRHLNNWCIYGHDSYSTQCLETHAVCLVCFEHGVSCVHQHPERNQPVLFVPTLGQFGINSNRTSQRSSRLSICVGIVVARAGSGAGCEDSKSLPRSLKVRAETCALVHPQQESECRSPTVWKFEAYIHCLNSDHARCQSLVVWKFEVHV